MSLRGRARAKNARGNRIGETRATGCSFVGGRCRGGLTDAVDSAFIRSSSATFSILRCHDATTGKGKSPSVEKAVSKAPDVDFW